MLEELIIKDFALIDNLSVDFDRGLNILSGETGAGKSIVVGAIGFLLGGKAEVESIRDGCEETSVAAILKIDLANADARAWLSSKEISLEDERIRLRRTLKKNGRSSAYIQEIPVSRTELVEFSAFLFDIHGQHEHQALLRSDSHRRYLDRYAGIEDEVRDFSALFYSLAEKRKSHQDMKDNASGREQKIELLRFAVDEIRGAAIQPGEISELEAEAKRLAAYERLAGLISSISEQMFDGEGSLLTVLRRTKGQMEAVVAIDPSLADNARRLDTAYYEFEDISDQIREYRDDLRYDPARLEEIESRLSFLHKLKKKYGPNEEAILQFAESAESELGALSRIEEDEESLLREIAEIEKLLTKKAADLSRKRRLAADALGGKITEILNGLGMKKARFLISTDKKDSSSGGQLCGPWGIDNIEFLIAPNLGEPMRELVRIASGGELSRVMLAIKTVLAKSDTVETLIFDEIDTGIGGEVALSVGNHLSALGKDRQIFCITHLASIAVRADNHLKVIKSIELGRTTTRVVAVEPKSRREEIARMLAGDAADSAALAHADELLAKFDLSGGRNGENFQ